jgi:hypothetical protein
MISESRLDLECIGTALHGVDSDHVTTIPSADWRSRAASNEVTGYDSDLRSALCTLQSPDLEMKPVRGHCSSIHPVSVK